MNANMQEQLAQISKDIAQITLFDEDEVVGTTDTEDTLHPNPRINKMLLANKAKRAKLKAMGLKETHKRKPKIQVEKRKYLKVKEEAQEDPHVPALLLRTVIASVKTLQNLGCVYDIRIGNNRWTQGVLEAEKPKKSNLPKDGKPYGERSHYLMEFIKDLKIGKVVEIPFKDFDMNRLQSTVASRCGLMYGSQCVTTHVNRKRNVLEVLRVR